MYQLFLPEPVFSPDSSPAGLADTGCKTLGAQADLQRHHPAPYGWGGWVCLSSRPINHLSPTQPHIPRPKAPTKGRRCGQARLGVWAGGIWGKAGAGSGDRCGEGGQDSSQVQTDDAGSEGSVRRCPPSSLVRQGAGPGHGAPFPRGPFHATSVFGGAAP